MLLTLLIYNCNCENSILVSCNLSPAFISSSEIIFVANVNAVYKLFIYDQYKNSVRYFNERLENTYEVDYSPIRDQIAFIKLDIKNKNSNIYMSDLQGSKITQITSKDFYHNYPLFSHNGKRLYFVRRDKSNYGMYFHYIDLITNQELRVCNTPFFVHGAPSMTNDDDYIIFTEGRRYQKIVKLEIKSGQFEILKEDETLLAATINLKTNAIIFAESDYKYEETKKGTKILKAIYTMDLETRETRILFKENFWECSFIKISPVYNEIIYMNLLNNLVISSIDGKIKRIVDLERLLENELDED